MATKRFRVIEHTLAASHIREYYRATAEDQEAVLQLAVKQYVPLAKGQSENAITIIAAHANGFPKELYEPLWDDLYERLQLKGIAIGSIWISDCANQGESGVLNEAKIGNDPSWMDHPRDLFLIINHFREHMKRPIVGIGHSMGSCTLVNLALMHSRLFATLILIEPVIEHTPSITPKNNPAKLSMQRRDFWPSRREAESAFKRSKFYQSWNPRVLDRWFRYGLREMPVNRSQSGTQEMTTAKSSTLGRDSTPIVLKTSRHQEVSTFQRQNPMFTGFTSAAPSDGMSSLETISPFHRPEAHMTFANLPHLSPSTFFVFGDKSALSTAERRTKKVSVTGTGEWGSGGALKGRVKSHTFHGAGHLLPFEIVTETANACSSWLVPEIARWHKNEETERQSWEAVPLQRRNQLTDDYVKTMELWTREGTREHAASKSKL